VGWRIPLPRLLPRSLLARSVLLISAILIASQLAWIEFTRLSAERTQSEQIASNVASVLNTVAVALETMPAASRRKFIEKLPAAMQNVRLLPATTWDVDEVAVPQSPLLAPIGEQLKRGGGSAQVIAVLEDADRALWVKLKVKDQAWWVVFPADAFGLGPAAAWAGWSVVSLVLALTGGLALMLRVNRPLRALTDAAADIAAGKNPPALPERGPSEIRTLSQAFNRMSSALRQQESNRAVLLAGVSHDLRTPLSRLRLALEMSSARLDPAVCEGMQADIEDMDGIINQFLDFARDATAEAPQARSDLNALVESLVERYRRRGQPVEARLAQLPPLDLKPMAVQRMITNLVDNALRYGGGPVEIETGREGAMAVLKVLDRGPGIPEQEVERVMQPFTRLEQARSDVQGAGLGLAIVDRVARLHGGGVRLAPRSGGGLEARVELPVTG
jgi:two-component system osmolarity sensor histidine kinase EnvZ